MSTNKRARTITILLEESESGPEWPGRVAVSYGDRVQTFTLRLDNFHNVEQTLLNYLPEAIQVSLEAFEKEDES